MIFRSIGKTIAEVCGVITSFFSFLQYLHIFRTEEKLKKARR